MSNTTPERVSSRMTMIPKSIDAPTLPPSRMSMFNKRSMHQEKQAPKQLHSNRMSSGLYN